MKSNIKNIFFILSLFLAASATAQEMRTISGKVIDAADGFPIPGATVYVDESSISNKTNQKGVIESASIGTVTDIDGSFELKISNSTTSVRVTYMGYLPYSITISAQQVYSVSL